MEVVLPLVVGLEVAEVRHQLEHCLGSDLAGYVENKHPLQLGHLGWWQVARAQAVREERHLS